jgi:signal transduction histidine kinase
MPGALRITGAGFWARPQLGGFAAAGAALCTLMSAGRCFADEVGEAPALLTVLTQVDREAIAGLALLIAVLAFAVVTAISLLRTRRKLAEAQASARDEAIALKAEVDRAHALLRSEPQVLVAWAAGAEAPDIIGDTSLVTEGEEPQHVLAFRTWLETDKAQAMEVAVEALQTRGGGFAATLPTLGGRLIEAEGQVVGGRAILRLKEVGGIQRELADLQMRFQKQAADTEAVRTLIEALPSPVWARDRAGKLAFANTAYARAVDVKDGTEAVERGLELFDQAGREELLRAHVGATAYAGRLPAIVGGSRHTFDVQAFPARRGSAGIGIDATEAESLRSEVRRMVDAHRRTLDQLPTGVAIFGSDQRLKFYNTAYRSLWDLDEAFLEQGPTDSAVLDRLRAERKLPEEADFRQWKAQVQNAYRALEANEHTWHLPHGRTLRVITTPNPEGGVTYLFHDVTRRLDLERRYEALIRVQGETLDNLAEAVAVFASDGRLRLFNPVFARMWRLDQAALAERPHIETVIGWCQPLAGGDAIWPELRATITAIDNRAPVNGRLERRDGGVVDCVTVPLPDGATLLTFQDVTDTVNVERALREKNEALEDADKIKIDFVHHVSYELRSPLTNIIGFSHFLADPVTGPLTDKQREYLDYIQTSTNALLAIINNILDLASIDAGEMKLALGPVDIRATMDAAAEGVQDRLAQNSLALNIRAAPDIGSFVADERRVRQALFNLLANAISFSPAGESVTLSARRLKDAVVFTVTDRGPGIPADMTDKVFDWFETHSLGSQHRGTGLGLSLVRSFVELHGGTVTLDSAIGRGTTVTCIFPLGEAGARTAA